jgi:pSer/pThr/pTyr-binding forkhead associated (FHA) protein
VLECRALNEFNTMRLSFANGEHADFIMEKGVASLGSAQDNTLVLPGRDIAAHHARLTVDARGIVLDVLDPAARTHVNARPVREKALLRYGDVLCLGKVVIALMPDSDAGIDVRVLPERSVPPSILPTRVTLRGVSGRHFGKSIPVNTRLLVGQDAACDLIIDDDGIAPRHAVIETVGDAIHLRGVDASGSCRVNGVRVENAVVYPGDQIAFERCHFLIEAPGLPVRGEKHAPEQEATAATATEAKDGASESASAQGAIGWLIGVAALIALALLLLLHRGI